MARTKTQPRATAAKKERIKKSQENMKNNPQAP
jgi:hypothetical protein